MTTIGLLRRFLDKSVSTLAKSESEICGSCGSPLTRSKSKSETLIHNPATCRLVNLALSELGATVPETIRVSIYPGAGTLKGFYFTADPYTINISEEAYSQALEYIIFHETKHLVDCLRFGRSEEISPDRFARALCQKYGYMTPPEDPLSPWFAYA